METLLNERAEGIRRDLGHDVLVVTIDNIVGGTPKQFSTALFNRWGIGDAARNDGVLLLLVTGQRRLEIETGIGMESILTDAWLQSMQQEAMVPVFKRGDLGGGLIAGLARIDGELRGQAQTLANGAAGASPAVAFREGGKGKCTKSGRAKLQRQIGLDRSRCINRRLFRHCCCTHFWCRFVVNREYSGGFRIGR